MPPRRKSSSMSAEHKRALAQGREQGRAVRNYLEALEQNRPKRGRKRTPESIKKRLAEINQRLATLPGWSVQGGVLTKTFTVRSFAHGVLFLGPIGQYAEAANHHPDVNLHDYSQVTVSLVTHSEGGITDKDAALAAQIEALPHKALK